ncbi:MAG: PD-(D/E)XK nuclease family transposase [Blautia sp.]|uniref:PD-(D/E)XK nuclease family transposase n=1 Tax=Blautia sp. TaxID=1955243 RepID=UPI002E7A974C|nr:PD-(D/E)XK nuclease family transposase [Blautia sp.]MEE1442698.1 PD-(D/E)XK nuclease family transposase [Blautia sp.]
MNDTMREYFPMLRTRKEVLDIIQENERLTEQFDSWEEEKQEEFLDFCTGVKGVKILYDGFFKEVFSPEYHVERLEEFLSLLLGKKIKIRQILPNDSVRLADEQTLLITDIVIEAEDGTIANLEIQKIGYAFPGQRLACYSADLLLRQYKRVKDKKREKNKKINYRDLKKVYTIVLFEKSTKEFHQFPKQYIHYGGQTFNTGLKLETLQESVLVPLDIFGKVMENKTIESKLEAWLVLISSDEPKRIIELLEKYPEFRSIYEEVYEMCRNVEEIMGLFSEELAEMDRNTISYMIEELEEEIKAEREKTKAEREKIKVEREKIKVIQKELAEKEKTIAELNQKIKMLEKSE